MPVGYAKLVAAMSEGDKSAAEIAAKFNLSRGYILWLSHKKKIKLYGGKNWKFVPKKFR